mgnify:CR=1 FL=1
MADNELLELDNSTFTDDYVQDIKGILLQAKAHSYRAANAIMTQAYWLIGYRIVVQEQNGEKRAGYGAKIIENLSKELNREMGSGMSAAHLWNCRQFYITFQSKEILYTLCRELSWSHIRLIMRLDTEKERNYYIEQSKKGAWSVRQLERNIKTETQDFYIDLVFYNYILKCFVLVDLKRGSLRHQDIGQMDMYVRMFDSLKKADDDNPTIGIIFCTDKDESIVKYSVLSESEQIFASKYKTFLPTEEELRLELDRNRRYLEEKYAEKKGVKHG